MQSRMKCLVLATAVLALGACTEGSEETSIVGLWEGYAEDSGRLTSEGVSSDRIAIEIIEVDADGQITGTIRFGASGTMEPIGDPNTGYPSGLRLEQTFGPWPFVETFAYSLTGRFEPADGRLRGDRNPNEVWSEWCELQTSYESDSRYGCLPSCGSVQTGDECELLCESERISVDCEQLALCNESVCDCGPGGCSVAGSPDLTIDLHLDGNELQGQLTGVGEIFLVRQ